MSTLEFIETTGMTPFQKTQALYPDHVVTRQHIKLPTANPKTFIVVGELFHAVPKGEEDLHELKTDCKCHALQDLRLELPSRFHVIHHMSFSPNE
jgi:hypothetical protein